MLGFNNRYGFYDVFRSGCWDSGIMILWCMLTYMAAFSGHFKPVQTSASQLKQHGNLTGARGVCFDFIEKTNNNSSSEKNTADQEYKGTNFEKKLKYIYCYFNCNKN